MSDSLLFENLKRTEGVDVICDALTRWCMLAGTEPDTLLMDRAIHLYNLGNDTTETLFHTLHGELID